MRTKKELYEIILNEYRVECCTCLFMCNVIEICMLTDLITEEEYDFIMEDLYSNRPSDSQHQEFINDTYRYESECWWSVYLSYNHPLEKNHMIRIAFLEKMIQINS